MFNQYVRLGLACSTGNCNEVQHLVIIKSPTLQQEVRKQHLGGCNAKGDEHIREYIFGTT